jgi:glycosyltransferase involved in cell wall biosynthesis
MGTPVSVVATVFNEAASIGRLLASLADQTVPPDEIVISDAGSTDGTREAITVAAAADPRIRLVDAPGGRSRGRNAAIAAASHEVIALIDGGCFAEPAWLERLTAPFAAGAGWVAGFYRPEGQTARSTCIGLVMVPVREEIDPTDFDPSARSMALTRSAWEAAGRFPEDLDFAEDTLFDRRLSDAGYSAEFAEHAVVVWTPPATLGALARTMFRWGRGDGLAGLRGWYHRRALQPFAVAGGAAVLLAAAVPRALPLALLPLAPGVWRRTRHKYRHAPRPAAYLWLPLADLTSTVTGLTGFLTGWWVRRRRTSPS